MMRILRVRAEGLPLYKDTFDVSFYAAQRVQATHLNALFNLSGNIYVNTAVAFIGINASGKTTALKVLSFASLLLCATPMNAEYVPDILAHGAKTVFDIDFYANNKIFHLRSEIQKSSSSDGVTRTRILSEKLWEKPVTSSIKKSNLLDYGNSDPVRVRNDSDEYLSEDVSIMIAANKQNKDNTLFVDLAMFTDFNLYFPELGNVPAEIITLLDPTIEYISVESVNNKIIIRLKFYGREETVLYNPEELRACLSSGTIKGVRVFMDAVRVLKTGGYLIVDEVENHFNRELVVSLIRLFMNKKTNPKGSVVVFSTHYPELLNEIERNDAVFITRNVQGLVVENLNTRLKRNDLKKSDIYQSDYLGGTAPKYSALNALQRSIIRSLEV